MRLHSTPRERENLHSPSTVYSKRSAHLINKVKGPPSIISHRVSSAGRSPVSSTHRQKHPYRKTLLTNEFRPPTVRKDFFSLNTTVTHFSLRPDSPYSRPSRCHRSHLHSHFHSRFQKPRQRQHQHQPQPTHSSPSPPTASSTPHSPSSTLPAPNSPPATFEYTRWHSPQWQPLNYCS